MSRDATSEEIKEAEVAKKPKKRPYAKGIDWLSESINIDVMYRVKGRQGIFMPRAKPQKSGLVRMASPNTKPPIFHLNLFVLL